MQKWTHGYSGECWQIFIGNQTPYDFMLDNAGKSARQAVGDFLRHAPTLDAWRENADMNEQILVHETLSDHLILALTDDEDDNECEHEFDRDGYCRYCDCQNEEEERDTYWHDALYELD